MRFIKCTLLFSFSLSISTSAISKPTRKSFSHGAYKEEGLFNSRTDIGREPGESTYTAVLAGIKTLQPAYTRAAELAQLLTQLSPAPMISVAIIMQESSFRDVHVVVEGFDIKTGELTSVYKDLGIAQLNAGTITAFGCNKELIISHDLHESIRCHSVVLAAKMEMCKGLGKSSFRCYNSSIDKYGRVYENAVNKWLKKIERN